MEILEYFSLPEARQAHWLEEIGKGDWVAARFLRDRIAEGTFPERYGPNARVLLATEGDALAGFCTLAERDDVRDAELTPWIGFVFTFPEYRGHRLSEKLIGRACALARAEGCRAVYLSSNEVGLYEKYGFVFLHEARDAWGGETQVFRRNL